MLPGTYLRTPGITQRNGARSPIPKRKGKERSYGGVLYTQGGKSPPEVGRVLVDSLNIKSLPLEHSPHATQRVTEACLEQREIQQSGLWLLYKSPLS